MMKSVLALLLTLSLLALVGGCGQKGPLYLPDDDAKNKVQSSS